MNKKKLSAEKIYILDFNAGAVIIRNVPLSMIEMDADEIMHAMEKEWQVREKDCQYMVSADAMIDDNTI